MTAYVIFISHHLTNVKIRGLFRGLGPPLTAAAVITGVTFETYEQTASRALHFLPQMPMLAVVCVAGAAAGGLQSFLACPVERLKCLIIVRVEVHMESDSEFVVLCVFCAHIFMIDACGGFLAVLRVASHSLTHSLSLSCVGQSSGGGRGPSAGMVRTARHVVHTAGVGSLYVGFSATLLRDIPGFAAFFMVYESTKRLEKKIGQFLADVFCI